VEYYEGSERIRKRRGSYEKAAGLADSVKIKLLNGRADALQLVGRDQNIYLSALERLKEWNSAEHQTGGEKLAAEPPKAECPTVDQVVGDFVTASLLLKPFKMTVLGLAHEAERLLKQLNGIPLANAVDFYLKHGTKITTGKTVPEILKEHLEGLRKDKNTEYHIRDTKLRVERFAEKFPGPIQAISTSEINEWLRGLRSLERNHKGEEISGRTRNNMRGGVVQLFNFAKENGYLSKDFPTAADATKKVKEVGGENKVFTPEALEKILSNAPEELIPSIVLKAFTGIRTDELIKLTWQHLHYDTNSITLTKDVTKLTQRRVIKMQPNLRAWLEPFGQLHVRV
jgi:hypothetical protein